jgi:hypothetical protein
MKKNRIPLVDNALKKRDDVFENVSSFHPPECSRFFLREMTDHPRLAALSSRKNCGRCPASQRYTISELDFVSHEREWRADGTLQDDCLERRWVVGYSKWLRREKNQHA